MNTEGVDLPVVSIRLLASRHEIPPGSIGVHPWREEFGGEAASQSGMRVDKVKKPTVSRQVAWWFGLLLTVPIIVHAERLPIKTYTTADGLAQNEVNRIVRDSRGFLWFCTEDGLSRYDGYAFTNYGLEQGLPDGRVRDLLETREGEYWVATGGGLCRFNPQGSPAPTTGSIRHPPSAILLIRCSRCFILAGTRAQTLSHGCCKIIPAPSGVGRERACSGWIALGDKSG